MTTSEWKIRLISVASLHPDSKNPRLGIASRGASPRELIQLLFAHDKAIDVAQSIALRGFFLNEPLLAIRENDKLIVVEGNRRLVALKVLRESSLLDDAIKRQVERLAMRIGNLDSIAKAPVIIAPNRRSTDRQIAGKHIGTPVLPWQSEKGVGAVFGPFFTLFLMAQIRWRKPPDQALSSSCKASAGLICASVASRVL